MNYGFLRQLRDRSCYPTFRGFIGLQLLVGYIAAAVIAIAGALSGDTFAVVGCVLIAIAVVFLAHVLREASLMLADIADAAIHTAANIVPEEAEVNQEWETPAKDLVQGR